MKEYYTIPLNQLNENVQTGQVSVYVRVRIMEELYSPAIEHV